MEVALTLMLVSKTLGAAIVAALNFFECAARRFFGAGFGTRKPQIWDRVKILSSRNVFYFSVI